MKRAALDVVAFVRGTDAPNTLTASIRTELEQHSGVRLVEIVLPSARPIATLATWLREHLSEIPVAARLHLVGHGEAGVVCRYYAQHHRDGRVLQTISLESPFGGRSTTASPRAEPEELAVGSPLLRSLALGARRSLAPPHLSVVVGTEGALNPPQQHLDALPTADVAVLRRRSPGNATDHPTAARVVGQRVRCHATTDPMTA